MYQFERVFVTTYQYIDFTQHYTLQVDIYMINAAFAVLIDMIKYRVIS